MILMKIYTKSGDEGETSLLRGGRLKKDDLRIELLGHLDEVQAWVGYLRSTLGETHPREALLITLQQSLFILGAIVACPVHERAQLKLPTWPSHLLGVLEVCIDEIEAQNAPLQNFLIPGPPQSSALAHLIRSQVRRCERCYVAAQKSHQDIEFPEGLKFLNRLSDFFFVLGREFSRVEGIPETLWIP